MSFQSKLGKPATKGNGRFMDTRHGDDFVAQSPVMTVAAWAKNADNPAMVAGVKHITTGNFYRFLFNHAHAYVNAPGIYDYYNQRPILGDPNDLQRVDYVITCYPRKVKQAFEELGGHLRAVPRAKLRAGFTVAMFQRLATKVVGLDYYGTTSIGHTGWDQSSFWIEFTNDEAAY